MSVKQRSRTAAATSPPVSELARMSPANSQPSGGHPAATPAERVTGRPFIRLTAPQDRTERPGLILSLYTGLGVLDRAFREAGWSVVSAGDIITGHDIAHFVPPAPGLIEGVIAGPPCQPWSTANRLRQRIDRIDFSPASSHHGVVTLRHILRVVEACQPEWWLVENVPAVPDLKASALHCGNYKVQRCTLRADECGCPQRRSRVIQFGSRLGDVIRPARLQSGKSPRQPAVMARPDHNQMSDEHLAAACERQGIAMVNLPLMTRQGRFTLVGNAVPLPMARVLAASVADRAPRRRSDCECGCGRTVNTRTNQRLATAGCRKRVSIARGPGNGE